MRFNYLNDDEFRIKQKLDFENNYIVLRLDGSNFSKLTTEFFDKIDVRFTEIMVNVAQSVLKTFNPMFVYTTSDEITVVFDKVISPSQPIFNGDMEKLISQVTANVSSSFTNFANLGVIFEFDCRIFQFDTKENVINMIKNRWDYGFNNSVTRLGWILFGTKKGIFGVKTIDVKNKIEEEYNFDEVDKAFRFGVFICNIIEVLNENDVIQYGDNKPKLKSYFRKKRVQFIIDDIDKLTPEMTLNEIYECGTDYEKPDVSSLNLYRKIQQFD